MSNVTAPVQVIPDVLSATQPVTEETQQENSETLEASTEITTETGTSYTIDDLYAQQQVTNNYLSLTLSLQLILFCVVAVITIVRVVFNTLGLNRLHKF